MLIVFIVLYVVITLAVGIYASKFVKNTDDYLLAGRKFPWYISSAALFATWFGSETVLGTSSQFAKEGFSGIIEDPIGAALCLLLLGLFFAKPLYRMNFLTFGDFYRVKYGKVAELIASIFLIISYLGWIAAQMIAIGVILNVVIGIPIFIGTIIGSCIVISYTFIGGMWSVVLTDFIQTITIIIGLIITTIIVMNKKEIVDVFHQTPSHYFEMFPKSGSTNFLNYFAALITIGLGSIPQQDIYQRVMSSKSERTAVVSSYIAAIMYLSIALLPLILTLYAINLSPQLLKNSTQLLIPNFIKLYTPFFVQVLFYGALLAAIMSTASGAIIAPAAILSENIFKHLFFKNISDKQFLLLSRISVLIVAIISLIMALIRNNIYELVGESSILSLVALFVPLTAGLIFKNSNSLGAILSMLFGMSAWLIAKFIGTEINELLYGLLASFFGMFIGYIYYKFRENSPG